MRVGTAALDRAAEIIGASIGATVERFPLGPDAGVRDDKDRTRLVAALTEGAVVETGFCMGAQRPHEMELTAGFELLAVEGTDEARRARCEAALRLAESAIAADPTLGGLVDWAEFSAPDPEDELRFTALAAVLTLTYTAPSALG